MRVPGWAFGARMLVAVGLLAGAVGFASAARFSLNPIRVHLGAGHPVETVVLGNQEDHPLSFEVQVKRWTQGADGAWTLEPSDDLVVHPLIVSVAAGGEARLRIGTLSPTTAGEQAYRVELQQLRDPATAAEGAQIRMLTRISLPVFVQPRGAKAELALAVASPAAAKLGLSLRNAGSAYVPPGVATLRVLDGDGRVVHQGKLTLGYLLAGAQLPVATAWPAGACGRAARVELTTAEGANLHADVPADLRRCTP